MRTALIVDDDPVSIRLIALILGRRGFNIASAAGASEALAWLEQRHPVEVIVLDQNLGGTTGLELYAILQTSVRFRCVPVVICTGSADWQVVNEAMKLGIKHLIVKPITPQTVIVKVEAAAAERVPVVEARASAMFRLQLSDNDYTALARVSRDHLARIGGELERASRQVDRPRCLALAEKLMEPARVLNAARLLDAIPQMEPARGQRQFEGAVALVLDEVAAIQAALEDASPA